MSPTCPARALASAATTSSLKSVRGSVTSSSWSSSDTTGTSISLRTSTSVGHARPQHEGRNVPLPLGGGGLGWGWRPWRFSIGTPPPDLPPQGGEETSPCICHLSDPCLPAPRRDEKGPRRSA